MLTSVFPAECHCAMPSQGNLSAGECTGLKEWIFQRCRHVGGVLNPVSLEKMMISVIASSFLINQAEEDKDKKLGDVSV